MSLVEPKVQRAAQKMGDHLGAILALFKAGAKGTIFIRHPDTPDGSRDLMVTSDTLDEAIPALVRLRDRGDRLDGTTAVPR